MIYKFEIYEHTPKNFKKGGGLKKSALTALGSFITAQPDETPRTKTPIVKHLQEYGYTDIHTGYVDNVLYMTREGRKYIAFQSLQLSSWPNAITIGFSEDLKS